MRPIDADLMCSQIVDVINKPSTSKADKVTYAGIMTWINLQPNVNAVAVVRCGDCKHYEKSPLTGKMMCRHFEHNTRFVDFCSYGERIETDENRERKDS